MYTPSYTDLASHLSMVTCAHILLIQHAQCNTHGAPLHVVTPMNFTSAASNVEFIFYIYINMHVVCTALVRKLLIALQYFFMQT